MATATVNQGKTSFVKQFLNDHPDGTTKTVNEAWQAAGFEGTISPTLVNKTRVKMNLTGNLRGDSKTAAKAKSAPRMPKRAAATPGKTGFLKEFLNDHPQGNVKAVNEAWTAAGFDGTISTALVYKARASLGLTGNLSGKTKKSEAKATSTGNRKPPLNPSPCPTTDRSRSGSTPCRRCLSSSPDARGRRNELTHRDGWPPARRGPGSGAGHGGLLIFNNYSVHPRKRQGKPRRGWNQVSESKAITVRWLPHRAAFLLVATNPRSR